MKTRIILTVVCLVLFSCGSQHSDLVIKDLTADIDSFGQASLWVEVYNEGDEVGEVTRWRVRIESASGRFITEYEEIAMWGDHSHSNWSPLVGAKQVSKFCVHWGRGPSTYKGATAVVAVWVRDEDGEYMIEASADFPTEWENTLFDHN